MAFHGDRTGLDSVVHGLTSRCHSFGRAAGAVRFVAVVALVSSSLAAQDQRAPLPSVPASFAKLSAKADAARDADRLDEAVSLYKKALAIRPSWAEGWWSLGTIAYDHDSYAEAAHAFEKMTSLLPKNGNGYVMLGLCEFEIGRDRSALQHLEKGANLGVDKVPQLRHVAVYHEALLLRRSGRFQEAEDILEQLCLNGVESREVIENLGMVLLRMRNKTSPTLSSQDAELVARVGHAGCLSGQKRFDEGKKEMGVLVSQNPTYPNIHYAFGMLLLEASDLAAANGEFKEEIKNNPTDFVSRLQIAAAMYKTDSAGGLPYAEEAVRLDPHSAFAHYLLGLLRLDVDDYVHAIPELEIAEKGLPREPKLYLALGTAYSRAGRRQEAAQARAAFTRITQEKKKRSVLRSAQPTEGTIAPARDMPTVPQ